MGIRLSPADCQACGAFETEKLAAGFFSRLFPSLSAARHAYQESRAYQQSIPEEVRDIEVQRQMEMNPSAGFFESHFPSVAAAHQAYQQSRDYENALVAQERALEAQRQMQMYPALHSTQPAMWMAQQQGMFGGGPSLPSAPTPPVHHRRHRRHHLG